MIILTLRFSYLVNARGSAAALAAPYVTGCVYLYLSVAVVRDRVTDPFGKVTIILTWRRGNILTVTVAG